MIKRFKKGEDANLGKHFSTSEFDCHCHSPSCDFTLVETDLIDALDAKREELGKPIRVISGFRCHSHNASVGGSNNSFHKSGQAADIDVEGMSAKELAEKCECFNGLGRYRGKEMIHVDVRKQKTRWWK